jgi:hypothetical protein
VRVGVAIPVALAFTSVALAVSSGDIRSYFGFIKRAHPSGYSEDIRIEQATINAAVRDDAFQGFELAFEHGDELFAVSPSAAEGSGANVDGKGGRFTRVPRADLAAWANQTPRRPTGPNAQACTDCHNRPFEDGAGAASMNVHRDPTHSGVVSRFIQRNTPHVFAPGAVQKLAEEMTDELLEDREQARQEACRDGTGSDELTAKGISFGRISARRTRSSPCEVTFDTSRVEGVNRDLIIRPFQWKGSDLFVRQFNRDAMNNELGMQAEEVVGRNLDGDGDGVTRELTVGDMTALAIYLAAQPRPTTKLELNSLGLLSPALTSGEISQINRGSQVFSSVGCASCHVPSHTLRNNTFSEPSQNPNYRDATFPDGRRPSDLGVSTSTAVKFDLTRDQPDNHIALGGGRVFNLGALRRNSSGHGLVEIFGDLKRHDMGDELAEAIDEAGTGSSVFLTENLWGVGSTAPYLHDGRATTLTEAILFHGGEAAASREGFHRLSENSKLDLLAFLENLVLFKQEEEE